jgi:hypothetical protein
MNMNTSKPPFDQAEVPRAAAPGRPKQGPALSEGRLAYSSSGVSTFTPGRPKQGPTLSEGRLAYSASGVLS